MQVTPTKSFILLFSLWSGLTTNTVAGCPVAVAKG